MKTIDLAIEATSAEAIFHIAEQEHVFVRTSNGKTFIITAVEPDADENDFD